MQGNSKVLHRFSLRLRKEQIGYIFFLLILLIFYVIPAPVQLPFKLVLLFGMFYVYVSEFMKNYVLKKREILKLLCIPVVIIVSLVQGSFHPSLLVVVLSIFPLLMINDFYFKLTPRRIKSIKLIALIMALGIIAQMVFFRYEGRPRMGYEINLSGAYLFLFFLFSDANNIRWGKVLIILLSIVLLSRLLVAALFLFYGIRFCKKKLRKLFSRFNWCFLVLFFSLLTCVFSVWYTLNMATSVVQGNTGEDRLLTINDGSNYKRFEINYNIVLSLILNNDKKLLIGGYGDTVKHQDYKIKYGNMPHHELIKSIAQFGLLTTIFWLFISMPLFNSLLRFSNFEYFISLLFYTQILWVRLTIVPSLIMILFIFIVNIHNQKE